MAAPRGGVRRSGTLRIGEYLDHTTPPSSGTAGEGARRPLGTDAYREREVDRLVDRVSQAVEHHAKVVRELEGSRERLSALLHAVGHDIRTPFVGIATTMQLLEHDAPNLSEAELRARVGESARSIRSSCGFGLSMIGEVFELIRSDGGEWSASPSSVDLVSLVHEVRAIVEPQARAKSLAIEVRLRGCSESALASVWTDAGRLTQALVNVVANGVKFSAQGSVEIELAMPAPDAVSISVRDRGPGLDNASVGKIFEPFYQSQRTSAQASEGLGLGLAIAERCARLIGGHWIAGNRSDGPGAVFTLVLPHRCAPATAEAVASGGSSAEQAISARVLVVDDAADAALLAQHHLAALGHSVTVATRVAEAERLLACERFDLVLSDFELSDGTAADLLPKAGRTPVLVSSAHLDEAVTRIGAAGTVPKPLTRASLQAAIDRTLGAFRVSAMPSS